MSDIEIKNLSFSYQNCQILKDINLSYEIKDFLCFIGPNGGGKSTLLKLILGLVEPDCGHIKVLNKKPKDASRLIGYMPQNIEINRGFPITALDVVLMGCIDKKSFGFYDKNDKAKAMNSLEMVYMKDFANRRIDELSGGQRQRIYIARALLSEAKILILDEPTSNIDPKGQVEIYELLKELNLNKIGIVMVCHDVNMALNFATKIAYVNKELFLHDKIKNEDEFIKHLSAQHKHFCDVELALKRCGCPKRIRTSVS